MVVEPCGREHVDLETNECIDQFAENQIVRLSFMVWSISCHPPVGGFINPEGATVMETEVGFVICDW